MSKLGEALDILEIVKHNSMDFYSSIDGTGYAEDIDEIITDAKVELLELQRLQSTVKEFIANHETSASVDFNTNDAVDFIESLCDIVGYSE